MPVLAGELRQGEGVIEQCVLAVVAMLSGELRFVARLTVLADVERDFSFSGLEYTSEYKDLSESLTRLRPAA
jgi:hypothetical protein